MYFYSQFQALRLEPTYKELKHFIFQNSTPTNSRLEPTYKELKLRGKGKRLGHTI
ncbi:MAG: hypothetical protein CH6_1039 [Candidatus Kapaibacterium sp.]|nr:MAG: hypothetical protein CH6_1039 [Candidatus Kapabacteria bacterium]